MLNALVIKGPVAKQLQKIVHRADLHPIPYGQLQMRVQMHERGLPVGLIKNKRNTIEIPVGYAVTYTCEEVLPGHPCRHLSVSGPNELPASEAVMFLMRLIGYQMPIMECRVWTEPLVNTHPMSEGEFVRQRYAVNVLEPMAGDWEAFNQYLATQANTETIH